MLPEPTPPAAPVIPVTGPKLPAPVDGPLGPEPLLAEEPAPHPTPSAGTRSRTEASTNLSEAAIATSINGSGSAER